MRLLTRLKAYSHTLETQIQANSYRNKDIFTTLKQSSTTRSTIKGYFNPEGAKKYQQKHKDITFKHFTHNNKLSISPIGIGTYKGSIDESDDLLQFNGIIDSVLLGSNMIDTCRNFRKGRSEQITGLALRHLSEKQSIQRNNIFVASKAGYVYEQLPKQVTSNDVVNSHCVHPLFIKKQIEKSLQNIGVQTLDAFYLNNFPDSQLQQLGKIKFEQKLAKALEALQKARSEGKIKNYGLSSWQSFRVGQAHQFHLSLHSVMRIAQKVAGKQHGLKFIQLPINIMMPQAFADKYIENKSFLDVAQEYNLNVVSSSPLLSGTLINIPMPADLLKCNYNGAKHLQLIRSIPSKSLICTLVGQKLNRHVRKNLEVLFTQPLDQNEWLNVFVPQPKTSNPLQV